MVWLNIPAIRDLRNNGVVLHLYTYGDGAGMVWLNIPAIIDLRNDGIVPHLLYLEFLSEYMLMNEMNLHIQTDICKYRVALLLKFLNIKNTYDHTG